MAVLRRADWSKIQFDFLVEERKECTYDQEIRDMGGVIREQREDYLAATFTSSIFRYVDDLEIRVDVAAGQIHLRSASRVGRSDLGANRARVERLKAALQSNVS